MDKYNVFILGLIQLGNKKTDLLPKVEHSLDKDKDIWLMFSISKDNFALQFRTLF